MKNYLKFNGKLYSYVTYTGDGNFVYTFTGEFLNLNVTYLDFLVENANYKLNIDGTLTRIDLDLMYQMLPIENLKFSDLLCIINNCEFI